MISEANRLPQAGITKRRKAVKLLSVPIAVFFLCWCLFFMYFFLVAIILKTLSKDKLASIAVLIALRNTIADPTAYAFEGDTFWKGFKTTFRQMASTPFVRKLLSICCCRRKNATGIEMAKEACTASSCGTCTSTPIGTHKCIHGKTVKRVVCSFREGRVQVSIKPVDNASG